MLGAIGAIYGDIAGSQYERPEHEVAKNGNIASRYEIRMKCLDPNTPLLNEKCFFTDDTILTMAVQDCLRNGKPCNETFKNYIRKFADTHGKYFGKKTLEWGLSDEYYLNDSWANGSAMRVSPVGFYHVSLPSVLEDAKASAIPTHNSEEGIRGAQAIASVVFFAKNHKSKEQIKEYVEENFYSLHFSLDDLQKNYSFDTSCEGSVPQAIFVFLESTGFENAIRLALSIGGDTDTIASMVGAMAGAYYIRSFSDIVRYADQIRPYFDEETIRSLGDLAILP